MIYEIRLQVDVENQNIRVIDSDNNMEIDGYLLVIGGDKCFVTSYGNIEAIAEGFANAYGTAKTTSNPFSKKLLTLLTKCITYSSLVGKQLLGRTEITSDEALARFEECHCSGDGGCLCGNRRVYN